MSSAEPPTTAESLGNKTDGVTSSSTRAMVVIATALPTERVPTMDERYRATMVLSAVGDAMGFHGGRWEFCQSGPEIHADLMRITNNRGVLALDLNGDSWRVSDDTIMHIATAEGLVSRGCAGWFLSNLLSSPQPLTGDKLCKKIAFFYKHCDLLTRAAGNTCATGIDRLANDGANWDTRPFDVKAAGCGAAMRSMCIGLWRPKPEQLAELVECALETGRITHHSGIGYLGAVVSALFTSYAVRRIDPKDWGWMLLEQGLEQARVVVRNKGRQVQENLASFGDFEQRWRNYLEQRRLFTKSRGEGPLFPSQWGVEERDAFYTSLSYSGWGGSSGHDAPMIAYDALLWAGSDYEKLCHAACLHGGDSDSTGVIALAWFGALFGFQGVPESHIKHIEFRSKLETLASQLLSIAIK